MKKLLILLLLATSAGIHTQAQVGRYGYGRRPKPVVVHRHTYHDDNHRYGFHDTDTYYGLRIGFNLSAVTSDDRYLNGSSIKSGLNLGMVAGFQVAHATPVFIETGLYYTEKGGKGNYNGAFSYQMNYLEVPLLMKCDFEIDADTSIQPFAGIYGAVGISGKIKDFNNRQAYSSFDDDAFQRFDAGLRFGCGLQYSHLYAEAGYDLGLANIGHDYFDVTRNGCFYASIGVNF